MQKRYLSGSAMVFLGAAFWSLNSPLVKFINIDSLLICGLRSIIASVALGAFIRPKQLKWNWWMLMYVFSYASLCLSVILALKMTSAPIAIGMQYTATIWLFLASAIQTKKIRIKALIPVVVIFMGVVLFMYSGSDKANQMGNLIAMFEGVFFACMTVSSKKVSGTNPIGLTAVANIFTGVLMLIVFPSISTNIVTMSFSDWVIMLILGVVQVGAGYAFYNMGVQKVSPQKASIIALCEMILGPIWVAIFLKEYPNMIVMIGFAVILFGMLLDARINNEQQK